MTKVLVLLTITLVCIAVNAQGQASKQKPAEIGQTFDEIVVSSDLNVRRKSKENRQGKKLLTNVPSGTTGSPGKSTAIAARLVAGDGNTETLDNRERRGITMPQKRSLDLGVAAYLLNSRNR